MPDIDRTDNPWTSVDPLGEALHFLHMSGVFYTRSEFTAPWALDLPAFPDCLMFHVVTSGQCWLEIEGVDPRLLQPGDLALVPHGEGHRLLSEPGVPAAKLFDLPREQISERYEILRHGQGGASANLICGTVRFDHPAAHQLVRLLPKLICIEAWQSPQMEWIQSTLRLMAAEASVMRPGGETIITRLADILVIQTIRSWMAQDPLAQTGWLGALQDKQIGYSILLIQDLLGQGNGCTAWGIQFMNMVDLLHGDPVIRKSIHHTSQFPVHGKKDINPYAEIASVEKPTLIFYAKVPDLFKTIVPARGARNNRDAQFDTR